MNGRRRDLAPAPIDRRVLEREVINVLGKRRLGDGGQSPAICHRRARPKADVRLDLFTTRFLIILASGLAASGRATEALALMDEAADLIEARGYASYLPELLRLKGSVLLLMSKVNAADAETCFKQSFEVSSMQGSRAWQLRTATDLASL
jgi:hypothetical protein